MAGIPLNVILKPDRKAPFGDVLNVAKWEGISVATVCGAPAIAARSIVDRIADEH